MFHACFYVLLAPLVLWVPILEPMWKPNIIGTTRNNVENLSKIENILHALLRVSPPKKMDFDSELGMVLKKLLYGNSEWVLLPSRTT
jgi:hypothetical protein